MIVGDKSVGKRRYLRKHTASGQIGTLRITDVMSARNLLKAEPLGLHKFSVNLVTQKFQCFFYDITLSFSLVCSDCSCRLSFKLLLLKQIAFDLVL